MQQDQKRPGVSDNRLPEIEAKPLGKIYPVNRSTASKVWDYATGFPRELLQDTWALAKGLFYEAPVGVGKLALQAIRDPQAYARELKYTFGTGRGMGDSLKGLFDSVTEDYRSGQFIHKPAHTIADVVTLVWAGGGLFIKSGKLAGGVVKAGKGVNATGRLIELGYKIQGSPGKIAEAMINRSIRELSGTMKGINRFAKAEEYTWPNLRKAMSEGRAAHFDLAKEKSMLDITRRNMSMSLATQRRVDGLAKRTVDVLTDVEKQMVDLGSVFGFSKKILDKFPRVRRAARAVTAISNMMRKQATELYGKTPKFFEGAAAIRARAEIRRLDPTITTLEARRMVRELFSEPGRTRPIYRPNIPTKGHVEGDDVIVDLIRGGSRQRTGKISQLEHLRGGGEISHDPSFYWRKTIKSWSDAVARERSSMHIAANKELSTRPGFEPSDFNPKTPPSGSYLKYQPDVERAETLRRITDPTARGFLTRLNTTNGFALIRNLQGLQSFVGRLFTVFNPVNWLTGQMFGNIFLSVMAGPSIRMARQLYKKGLIPPEILASIGAADIVSGKRNWIVSLVSKFGNGVSELGNKFDQMARLPIFAKQMERNLKRMADLGDQSGLTVEKAITMTAGYNDLNVKMSLVEESARRNNKVALDAEQKVATAERASLSAAHAGEAELRRIQGAILEAGKIRNRKIADIAARGAKDVGGRNAEFLAKERLAVDAAFDAQVKEVNQYGQLIRMHLEQPGRASLNLALLREKRDSINADITRDLISRGEMMKLIPEYKPAYDITMNAINRANAFVGEYLGLDGFEQGVLRRTILFYPWVKSMTLLAFRLPFLSPGATFSWNKFGAALSTITRDPELGEQFDSAIPLYVTKDGQIIFVDLRRWNPFGGLRTSEFFGIPYPSLFNVFERNPFISLALKGVGAKTIFDKGTIPYGEPVVNVWDGSVAEFTRDGKIRQKISQPPLMQALLGMFPQWQMIRDTIVAPYWTNKYDQAGIPQPIYNPDGTIRFQKEWQDRISSLLGVKMITRKREDIIRSNRIKVRRILFDLKKMYRGADANERVFIRQIFRDYAKGQYRQFDYD